MPIELAVGDRIQIVTGCYAMGQAGLNVSNWRVSATTGVIDLEDVVAHMDDVFAPLYKALMGGVATWYGVRGQRLAPGARTVAVVSAENVGVGTAGAAILPTQTCGLISLYTELAGSGNRGRLYIPFPAEADNADATATPTADYEIRLDALGTAYSDPLTFAIGVDTITLRPYVKHGATVTGEDVSGFVSRSKWATQRRRGGYGKANSYPPF